MTTYKDIYNAETRALISVLMGWRFAVAERFGRDREQWRLIAADIAISGIWIEWARTHDTQP